MWREPIREKSAKQNHTKGKLIKTNSETNILQHYKGNYYQHFGTAVFEQTNYMHVQIGFILIIPSPSRKKQSLNDFVYITS